MSNERSPSPTAISCSYWGLPNLVEYDLQTLVARLREKSQQALYVDPIYGAERLLLIPPWPSATCQAVSEAVAGSMGLTWEKVLGTVYLSIHNPAMSPVNQVEYGQFFNWQKALFQEEFVAAAAPWIICPLVEWSPELFDGRAHPLTSFPLEIQSQFRSMIRTWAKDTGDAELAEAIWRPGRLAQVYVRLRLKLVFFVTVTDFSSVSPFKSPPTWGLTIATN